MRQRSLTIAHRLHPVPRIAAALAAASFLGLVAGSASAQKAAAEEEDLSVEGLYRTASELAIEGKFEESAAKFEKLFDLVGDLLCEDYGPQSGGIVFDYGNALIQLQRWADARDAFQRCHTFSKTECAKSKIPGENTREKLALFQWGFCEAQLGNHEQALQLYDQYLAAKPDPAELAKIRNGFKLRYGTSLVKVGKLAEGSAAITELFDNREAWQVTPQFLMQGLLELGLGWVENAQKASTPAQIAEIEKSANLFLDKNAAFVAVQPVESFRYGFIDRMKKLGLECARSGLGGLSIRFFSMVPSLDEVMQDAESRVIFNAGYQQIVDQVKEQMGKPIPPDFEVLKILGMAYEKLGNAIAAREIYWQLAEDYPDVDKEQRAEVLHEAARFSAQMGDYSAAQYFGEVFVSEMPEDHKLRNNISVFMLQSLFTSGQYEAVITVCNDVRTRFELGDEKRELADAYLGLALYVLGRHQEAQDVLDEFAKTYKESGNREMVMYHRASNRLILGEFRKGADLLTEFLAEFPKSERYADRALGDLALARFNLEDYDAAIAAVDQLAAEFPDSASMDRALNIKGDCLLVKSDEAEEDADKEKIRQEALDTLLAAIDTGKKLQAAANEQAAPAHKATISEAYAKAIDIQVGREAWEDSVKLYDQFFPDYAGTFWEPQVSVFTLPALEAVGRGEDGLKQLEKMIIVLGDRDPPDIDLLRRAIGSYSDASVRVRGAEATLAQFDAFPGLSKDNIALLTWLMMQKVIVLQGMKAEVEKGSPEAAEFDRRIAEIFSRLEQFEVKSLSEIALKMIGDYLSKSENPFLAVRFYEELLVRDNPKADELKASADLNLGRIEARSTDQAKLLSARERFVRVTEKYGDKALEPEAWLERGRVAMKMKRWDEAKDAFLLINQKKRWLDQEQRAESNYSYGESLEQVGDLAGAIQAYVVVWNSYEKFPDWAARAMEKWLILGFQDADTIKDEAGNPDPVKIREKKVDYFKFLKRKLFQWQNRPDADSEALPRLRRRLPEMRNELGITAEEEKAINFNLGLPDDWTVSAPAAGAEKAPAPKPAGN